MSLENAITQGIVFKKGKDTSETDDKNKNKPKLSTYLRGTHGSGSARQKAEYKFKRALRNAKNSRKK